MSASRAGERIPVVVIGAGPAGLAASYELQQAGVEHVVLERGDIGQSWRTRWDSFCLVTPNWTMLLPGGHYDGDDPDGFMPRDQIVAHFERYAAGFDAPIRTGVSVTALAQAPNRGFQLTIQDDDVLLADHVIVATGTYQKPYRPASAAALPADVFAIDAEQYAKPEDLPSGRVLIVGSGQTGCQIAEELNRAGRDVTIACGKAPWAPRRIEGRDFVSWMADTPFLEHTPDVLPGPLAKFGANFQVTGRDGGHDLNYRTLQAAGVTLAGRFGDVDDHQVLLAPDLEESVAFGDARYQDAANLIRQSCLSAGRPAPDIPPPSPFHAHPPARFDLRGCGAVIFTAGFRPDYGAWIHFPGAFDDWGFPIQRGGVSTVVPGLSFVGTHFLRKRKSATLLGFGEDAAVVVRNIAERMR